MHQVNFPLSNGFLDPRATVTRFLCPGSPVTFTQFERATSFQAGVTIRDFHLPILTFSNGETHVFTVTKTTTATPAQK